MSNTKNDSLAQEVRNKEEFLAELHHHHGGVSRRTRDLVDRNFSFLQRWFTSRELAKLAQKARLAEAESEVSFLQQVLELSQDVKLDSLRVQYGRALTAFEATANESLVRLLNGMLLRLESNLAHERVHFAKEIKAAVDGAEAVRDNATIYDRLIAELYREYERYFQVVGALLDSFEKDVQSSLAKYSRWGEGK